MASSRRVTPNRIRRTLPKALAGTAALLLAVMPLFFAQAASATSGEVTMTARIDGTPLSTSSEAHPIKLYPLRSALIAVTIHNETDTSLHVATVRLAGQVMGLTFFAYDTTVEVVVPPGRTVTHRYALGLLGLNGQATGLIQSSLAILGPGQQAVASQGLVVDVRGSLRSVYGMFGLAIAVLTALAFTGALVRLARHRLHPNRFRRGLRFLVPGIGLGLFLVFTLSATRVFVPQPGRWVPLLVVSAVVLFGLGYLTPSPELPGEEPLPAPAQLAGLPLELAQAPAGEIAQAPAGEIAAARPRLPAPPPGGDDAGDQGVP